MLSKLFFRCRPANLHRAGFIAGFLLMSTCFFAQIKPVSDDPLYLFSNSAYTLPVRQGGFALFHTSRYGISKRVELGFHPLLVFLSPDIEVKWKQIEAEQFTLASFHSINYPSPLLRTLQIKGTGGIVAREFTIPDMFAFQNGVLLSTAVGGRHFLSGKFLFEFAVNTQNLSEHSTVDLPLVYPRSEVYYKGYGFITGVSAEGKLLGRFSYLAASDAYFFPAKGFSFFSENTLGLVWRTGKKFMLMGGAELTYGEYPFGTQWHLLPVLDFRWFLRV